MLGRGRPLRTAAAARPRDRWFVLAAALGRPRSASHVVLVAALVPASLVKPKPAV